MPFDLTVTAFACEAKGVAVIELRSARGDELPAFTAGAHLEVLLANGLIRHYSLCNDPAERDRYVIAVGLSADSRGGSRFVHESVRVGSTLTVSGPINNFELDAGTTEAVFIAGGIGITPILAMIRTCAARGRPWRLAYCVRSRHRAAFLDDLAGLPGGRLHVHADDERGELFDAAAWLAGEPPTTQLYCCGPSPLMDAVAAAASNRPAGNVHFEYFTAAPTARTGDTPFTVVLEDGSRHVIPADQPILDVLEAAGRMIPYSCRQGLCGTCKTKVLAGTPDHRDTVLSAAQRAANNVMTICVSRSHTDELTLAL